MKNVIIQGSIVILIGTFFSKILGFIREIIFAYHFGASTVSDAFFVTNGIPTILFSAIAIAINTSFIPLYMQIKNTKEQEILTSNLLNVSFALTVFGVTIINLFPYQVLGLFVNALSDETLHYAVPMLRVVSFSIIPIIIGRVFQAYSQSNNHFVSTALLGIVTNVVIIISYLLASEKHFLILSFGNVIAQSLAMLMFLYSAYSLGFKHHYGLDIQLASLKSMAAMAFPLMIGRFAEDASVLVDRNLAAGLGTGVISSLSYATLLSNAISSMITTSLVTAAFPVFSRLIAEKKYEEFASAFQKYFQFICYFFCPVSIYMLLFCDDIVITLFQHGSLQSSAAQMVWECTACYAVGIVPLGLQNYMIRGFYAFGDTKKPTYIIVFSLICNIFLSIWSADLIGYIGIAISTSVSYLIACCLLIFKFQTEYKIPVLQLTYKDLVGGIVYSIFPATIVYYLFRVIGITEYALLRLLLETLLFGVIYISLFLYTHKSLFYRLVSYTNQRREP